MLNVPSRPGAAWSSDIAHFLVVNFPLCAKNVASQRKFGFSGRAVTFRRRLPTRSNVVQRVAGSENVPACGKAELADYLFPGIQLVWLLSFHCMFYTATSDCVRIGSADAKEGNGADGGMTR